MPSDGVAAADLLEAVVPAVPLAVVAPVALSAVRDRPVAAPLGTADRSAAAGPAVRSVVRGLPAVEALLAAAALSAPRAVPALRAGIPRPIRIAAPLIRRATAVAGPTIATTGAPLRGTTT